MKCKYLTTPLVNVGQNILKCVWVKMKNEIWCQAITNVEYSCSIGFTCVFAISVSVTGVDTVHIHVEWVKHCWVTLLPCYRPHGIGGRLWLRGSLQSCQVSHCRRFCPPWSCHDRWQSSRPPMLMYVTVWLSLVSVTRDLVTPTNVLSLGKLKMNLFSYAEDYTDGCVAAETQTDNPGWTPA